MSELADLLRARLPDVRITDDGDPLWIELADDDGVHAAHIRMAPSAEIVLTVPPLGGFTLAVSHVGSRLLGPRGPVPFDRRHQVVTNDPALARLWLDEVSTQAILSTHYHERAVRGSTHPEARWSSFVDHAWHFELGGSALAVQKGSVARDPERMIAPLVAGARVAGAAHRIARAWAEVARVIGGSPTSDRWAIGGDFEVVCDRRGSAVHLDAVRTLRHEEEANHRLRTRVRAARVATDGDTLLLWRRGVPGYPPTRVRRLEPLRVADLADLRASASAPERGLRRLDSAIRALIASSRFDALAMDAGEVSVWFEGLVMDPARLDAAVELCARLAIDRPSQSGPYR